MVTVLGDTNGAAQMPRRRRHRERDTTDISSPLLPNYKKYTTPSALDDLGYLRALAEMEAWQSRSIWDDTTLTDVEDRRRFHPKGRFRPPASISTRASARLFDAVRRPTITRPNKLSSKKAIKVTHSPRLRFLNPKHLAICIRRKIRREVIHALRHNGGGGSRKRRFNEYSKIHC